MSATRPEAPYVVEDRPGPGLATITDRRDGTTRLWSRTLARGRGKSRDRRCANCGVPPLRGFYRPPQRVPANADRLCVACVEGPSCGFKAR